jgi:hypothetical protein
MSDTTQIWATACYPITMGQHLVTTSKMKKDADNGNG